MKKRNNGKLLLIIGFYLTAGFMTAFYVISKNNRSVPVSLMETASLEGRIEAESKTGAAETETSEMETVPLQTETETEPEATSSQIPEEPKPEKKHRFAFVSTNKRSVLYVRAAPSMSGKIIGRLKPGTEGKVLEIGENWSLITDGTVTGYSSNRYLLIWEEE